MAWFTGADDIAAVKIAFSHDSGATFDAPLRIDERQALGRVDAAMPRDRSALITWVGWTGTGEALRPCRARPETGCNAVRTMVLNDANASVNFPRMVAVDDGVFLAWTDPTHTTIRAVLARF